MLADVFSSDPVLPPISQRALDVPWSGIRRMFGLAAQMPDAINLGIGQPDFPTPRHIVEAAHQALDAGYTRYAPALGLPELREAIARKIWRENGFQVDPDQEVIVTTGAVEGLLLALMAFLDPGDEVLVPDPGYTNYEGLVRVVSGVPVRVPAPEENGFQPAPEDVEKAITRRTKVLILNSPANPTGATLDRTALQRMAEIAVRHNLFVISDEAYEKFVYEGFEHVSVAAFPGMKERTASVYTLSKTYAMTGWRVGFVVGGAEIIQHLHRMQEVVVSCVATFVQKAAVAALDGPQDCVRQMVAEYEVRRRFIVEALNEMEGVRCLSPLGAFYVFPNISAFGRPSEEVAVALARENKVVCVPGTAFGPRGEGYLRISYAAPLPVLAQGVERIREGLAALARRG